MIELFMIFMFTTFGVYASGEPTVDATPKERKGAHLRKLFLDDVVSYEDMEEAVKKKMEAKRTPLAPRPTLDAIPEQSKDVKK